MADAFSAAAGTDPTPGELPPRVDVPAEDSPAGAPVSPPSQKPLAPTPVDERIATALRQAAPLAVALLVVSALAARLRPLEATERGVFSTPFLWAAVVWIALLIVHAVAFEKNQLRRLEREPLLLGVAAGLLVFVVGIARFNAGPAARRILYLAINALGAGFFWWGVFSLVMLLALAGRDRIST